MTGPGGGALPYRLCAGVMLFNRDGLVFVGERIDTPGAWQMPQGGIDPGEAPEAAALRELWEETGIPADLAEVTAEAPDWITYDLPPHLVGKAFKGKYGGQKMRWYLIRFVGADSEIDIATEHPEFSAWKWQHPGDLVDEIVPFKRAVYAEVVQAFWPILSTYAVSREP